MTSAPPLSTGDACGACCPVCRARRSSLFARTRDVEYFTSPAQFEYFRCEECRAVFLKHPPMEQLPVIYPGNYYSFQPATASLASRVKDALDKRLFRWCLAQLPPGDLAVMDVGGGTGYQLDLVRAVEARVKKTTVVDLDPDAETIARKHGHEYFHGRIEDFQSPIRYHLVLALNLIEHVADPLAVLTKMQECLAPGGMIVIKTPNLDSWDARLFRHHNWGGFHCPRHWVLFDEVSFLALARRAWLVPIQMKLTQGAPFWAVSFLAALHARGWIKLGPSRPAFTHPLYKLFILLFAAFDFLRSPFAKTSQMFCVLCRA
jgi:SAM-dependent methyltransferase